MNGRDLSSYLEGYVKGYGHAIEYIDSAQAAAAGAPHGPSAPSSGTPSVPASPTPPPTDGPEGPWFGDPAPAAASTLTPAPVLTTTPPEREIERAFYIQQGMVLALRAAAEDMRHRTFPRIADELERRARGVEQVQLRGLLP